MAALLGSPPRRRSLRKAGPAGPTPTPQLKRGAAREPGKTAEAGPRLSCGDGQFIRSNLTDHPRDGSWGPRHLGGGGGSGGSGHHGSASGGPGSGQGASRRRRAVHRDGAARGASRGLSRGPPNTQGCRDAGGSARPGEARTQSHARAPSPPRDSISMPAESFPHLRCVSQEIKCCCNSVSFQDKNPNTFFFSPCKWGPV